MIWGPFVEDGGIFDDSGRPGEAFEVKHIIFHLRLSGQAVGGCWDGGRFECPIGGCDDGWIDG